MKYINTFIDDCVQEEFFNLPLASSFLDNECTEINHYVFEIYQKIINKLNNHSFAYNGPYFIISVEKPKYQRILDEISKKLKENGYSLNINYEQNTCHICIGFNIE